MQTLSIVVGGMVDRPALVDGRLEQHTYLSLSLTFDHDVVDGAPAARFVSRLRVAIENPERPSSASPRS
jgi:pyruvate/2-oxoglutarate dehydrogenase complex dihydrolipoamide acyltransferase (E2) component